MAECGEPWTRAINHNQKLPDNSDFVTDLGWRNEPHGDLRHRPLSGAEERLPTGETPGALVGAVRGRL